MTMAQAATRILLVDDHEIVRFGLRLLIESQPGLRVVGETQSRDETIAAAEREQPDIVLLDLDLGPESGLELISELRRVAVATRIIVLTGIREPSLHQQAVRQGAVGLVLKEHSMTILLQAIEYVAGGRAWLDPRLVADVLTELSRACGAETVDPEQVRIATLTEREREVVYLICEGLQNKAIAERLSISDATVRHHLTSIFSKLELQNRLELVIYAYRNGLARVKY